MYRNSCETGGGGGGEGLTLFSMCRACDDFDAGRKVECVIREKKSFAPEKVTKKTRKAVAFKRPKKMCIITLYFVFCARTHKLRTVLTSYKKHPLYMAFEERRGRENVTDPFCQ